MLPSLYVMDNVARIDQSKNNIFMAKQCNDKAVIYEDIHHKINTVYLSLFDKHGVSVELCKLRETAEDYLGKANSEWLAKRQYEKGEL